MKEYFPPMPMSRQKALKLAKSFAFIGYQITRLSPSIISDLAQAEMTYDPQEYCALALISAAYQAVLVFILITATMYFTGNGGMLVLGAGISAFVGVYMYIRSMAYPGFIVTKRVHDIEQNFLYALRHILIQVRGGTPIFNSMVSVSEAEYGAIALEFRRVIQEINSGKSITDAMERMALRNPSIYLRRTIWQMVNALRTGSDMGKTLQVVVDQFTAEQRVLIQKFAKELAPWAMMYMMVTVVFPTLGITLFLIISSLSSLRLSEPMLIGYIIISMVIQYFFIQFLKTKRPVMRW